MKAQTEIGEILAELRQKVVKNHIKTQLWADGDEVIFDEASAKLQRLMVGEQVALLDRLIKRARLLELYTSVAMLQDEKYKLKALSHIQEARI